MELTHKHALHDTSGQVMCQSLFVVLVSYYPVDYLSESNRCFSFLQIS